MPSLGAAAEVTGQYPAFEGAAMELAAVAADSAEAFVIAVAAAAAVAVLREAVVIVAEQSAESALVSVPE